MKDFAATSSSPVQAAFDAAEHRDHISAIAFAMWESEGRPEGRALKHWLKAEKLVEAEWMGERRGRQIRE